MRLGAPIFDADGCIHPEVRFATLAAFVWQQETGTAFDPAHATPGTPHLGTRTYSARPAGALNLNACRVLSGSTLGTWVRLILALRASSASSMSLLL